MSPGAADAVTLALEEVGVQLDAMEKDGAGFVRDYISHLLDGDPRPHRPIGMHMQIAAALRDIAIDEATAQRIFGRRRRG